MALTENDYKLIDELKIISDSIYDSYAKLRELEIDNKKDTVDYVMVINNITSLKMLENKIYSTIEFNKEKVLELMDFVMSESPTYGTDFRIATSTNKEQIINRRIFRNLIEFNNNKSISNLSDITLTLINLPNAFVDGRDFIGLAVASAEKDMINSIYSIIDIYLDDDRFSNIKDNLLNLKYNFSFIYSYVEQTNLENNFNKTPLYWSKRLYCDIFRIPEEELHIKDFQGMNQFFFGLLMSELLKKESSMSEQEKVYALIFFRTSLLFLTEDELNNLKYIFETGTNNVQDKQEIKKLIIEIFNEYEKDKNIPRLVRLSNENRFSDLV